MKQKKETPLHIQVAILSVAIVATIGLFFDGSRFLDERLCLNSPIINLAQYEPAIHCQAFYAASKELGYMNLYSRYLIIKELRHEK